MIPLVNNPLTQSHQGADALRASRAVPQALPTGASKVGGAQLSAEQAKAVKAAQQFEAIFLRQLMSALESTGSLGGAESSGSASEIYGSMMVNAMAEQSAQAGGIGLAEMVARALAPPPASPTPDIGNSANISTTYGKDQ